MKLKRIALMALLTTSTHLFAEAATKYQPSDADMKRLKTNLCEMTAEKAKSITRATIKSERFDATSEVIDQTAVGSDERKIMQQLFQSGGLISTVLIQSASFGAAMMPLSDAAQIKQDIEELVFLHVRSLCISASLEQ